MNSGFIDVEVKVVVAGPNGRNFRAAWDKQKERSEATLAESCVYLGRHSVFLQDSSYTSAKSPKMGVPLEYINPPTCSACEGGKKGSLPLFRLSLSLPRSAFRSLPRFSPFAFAFAFASRFRVVS